MRMKGNSTWFGGIKVSAMALSLICHISAQAEPDSSLFENRSLTRQTGKGAYYSAKSGYQWGIGGTLAGLAAAILVAGREDRIAMTALSVGGLLVGTGAGIAYGSNNATRTSLIPGGLWERRLGYEIGTGWDGGSALLPEGAILLRPNFASPYLPSEFKLGSRTVENQQASFFRPSGDIRLRGNAIILGFVQELRKEKLFNPTFGVSSGWIRARHDTLREERNASGGTSPRFRYTYVHHKDVTAFSLIPEFGMRVDLNNLGFCALNLGYEILGVHHVTDDGGKWTPNSRWQITARMGTYVL